MFRGVLFVLGSAVCYGVGPIIFKSGMAAGLQPLDLLMCRFSVAAVLLAVLVLIKNRGRFGISRRTLLRAAFVAPVFNCSQTFFFVTALKYISAATNSLILYFYPLAVAVLSRLCFGFRGGREFAIALGLVLSGSVFVSCDAFSGAASLTGIAASLGAMLVFSVNLIVLQRFLKNDKPLEFTLCIFVIAAIIFASIRGPGAVLDYTPRQALFAVLAGVVPTALSMPLLYLGVARIGSAYAAIFSSLELVVTVVLSGVVLGETVSALQVAGTGCILAGVILPNVVLMRRMRDVKQGAGG